SAQGPNLFVPVLPSSPVSCEPTATQWNSPLASTPSLTPLAANTSSFSCSFSAPGPSSVVGPLSYQTTHGTPSLAPVNAMSGSTPLRVGSTLRLGSVLPGPTRGT